MKSLKNTYQGGRFDLADRGSSVTMYDISSAYPWALTHAPQLTWWQRVVQVCRKLLKR